MYLAMEVSGGAVEQPGRVGRRGLAPGAGFGQEVAEGADQGRAGELPGDGLGRGQFEHALQLREGPKPCVSRVIRLLPHQPLLATVSHVREFRRE